MHSFQNFIVRLIPNHPPPLETRIWKLVVRALNFICPFICSQVHVFEKHPDTLLNTMIE